MIGHDLLGRRPSDTNSYLTADRAGPASARVWEWGWVRKNFSKKKKPPTDHQLAQAGTNWPRRRHIVYLQLKCLIRKVRWWVEKSRRGY